MKRAIGPCLVAAISAAYLSVFVHYGYLLEDEGLLLLQIARTFHGERPYLDFHTGYSPGIFYANAALFWLFGKSVVPVRIVLVGVNAASAALLFVLARQIAGTGLAAVAALGFVAYLPVFIGLFAAANVPYPSWYGVCAFLATQLAFDRHLASGRRRPLVVAGVIAGIAFSFKQNTGSLAALSCGLTLALCRAGDGDRDRVLARVLLVLGAVFLLAGFTVAVTTVEAVFILGPTIALIAGRLWRARAPGPPTGPLVPSIALVAAGALVASLPWLVPFIAVLGVYGLLHEIFLVGTDFDLVYATPYPVPFGFPQAWALVGAVGLAAVALAAIAVERGRLRRTMALAIIGPAVLVGGVCLAMWARVPEGLARSIELQLRNVGFFASPLLGLLAGLAWLRRVRPPGAAFDRGDTRWLGMLVFALCSYAQLYPRIDETHLLIAQPSGLVLGAWAASRTADAWSRLLGAPRVLIHGAVVTAGAVAILVAAVPSLGARFALDGGGLRTQPTTNVAAATAPVFLDRAHDSDVHALNALLAYLRARLRPGEGVFGFPGVALVPYLLEHPSVTRHDYWYAGRPDHLEEAVVVRSLATLPPRYVVTVNRNIGFFSNSARYYFMLRAFVRARYTLAARFGRYDVLVLREHVEGPPHIEDFVPAVGDDLRARLAEPRHESRYAAMREFFRRAGSVEGVAREAATVARDEATLLLLLRAIPEAPDVRSIPFLVRTFDEGTWRVRGQAAQALVFVAIHSDAEYRYLLAQPADAEHEVLPPEVLSKIDVATTRSWLAGKKTRFEVGVFAAWILAELRDADAIPVLKMVAREESTNPYLRLVAAYALVRAGRPEFLCDLVSLLGNKRHDYQDAIPSLVIEAASDHPTEVTSCLTRGLSDDRPRGREVSAWTAGAAAATGTAPALRTALRDPERRVRIAAVWALGRVGDAQDAALLESFTRDADEEMRAFAEEARARLRTSYR